MTRTTFRPLDACRACLAGIAAIFIVSLAARAGATPLTMTYDLTDLGGGVYQYDFTLTLDNHDASWVAGQQWDWIIFGDNDFADTYNGFDTNGGALGAPDWSTLAFAPPISSISSTSGAHDGPTLALATNGVLLPGWNPVSVGETLSWSGTSHVLIPSGQLRWSTLVIGGGAQNVAFEIAQANVPEPATLALVGLALTGLAVGGRRGTRFTVA